MNIEEKAKRYADGIIENCQLDSPWNCEEIHWQLRDAYTQAVTDLSAENEKLRDALRELVEDIEERGYGECFEGLLPKAKQLITEEK